MSKGSRRRPSDPAHVHDCTAVGHTQPDARGCCYRCGERIAPEDKWDALDAKYPGALDALLADLETQISPLASDAGDSPDA